MQAGIALPTWTAKLARPARIAVEAGLVLLVGLLSARLLWLLIAPGDAVAGYEARPLPAPVSMDQQRTLTADRTLLVRENPFQGTAPAQAVSKDAPETRLNLKLVALFMSTRPGGGSATIVTPDNETERFEPGDEILPNVYLRRVLTDRVMIQRDGETETLMMGGRESGLSVISEQSNAARASSAIERAPEPDPEPEPETFRADGQILIASLNVIPERENDEVIAYRLEPRGSSTLMMQAGLEPGDRVLAINGRSVSGLEMQQLAGEFRSAAETVSLTVEREGRVIPLRLELEEG